MIRKATHTKIQHTTSKFLPLDEALSAAQSLGLANRAEWTVWSKAGRRPPNVPAAPPKAHKDGGGGGTGWALATDLARQSSACRLVRRRPWRGPASVAE